jgi:hypothetical protein
MVSTLIKTQKGWKIFSTGNFSKLPKVNLILDSFVYGTGTVMSPESF